MKTGGCVLCERTRVAHLLVVHVAGAADERGPALRMELQGGDAVPSVSLPGDLRSQDLQAVSRRKACETRVELSLHYLGRAQGGHLLFGVL